MVLAAVGDANAVKKLTPHSSRKWAKRVRGNTKKPIFWTRPSSIKSSARTIPATIIGTMVARYWADSMRASVIIFFYLLFLSSYLVYLEPGCFHLNQKLISISETNHPVKFITHRISEYDCG